MSRFTLNKKAVVVHSGGMDSSICLALALKEFSVQDVLSLSFSYNQRHSLELERAAQISKKWGVDHTVVPITSLQEITEDALLCHDLPISHLKGEAPNTLVVGRNGLMAQLAAIHAHHIGAHCIYMGVIEVEEANSGYRDCSRYYMDLKQELLRVDLNDPTFEIRTPLVFMTKKETLEVADQLGVLPYLIETTVTCYEGISHPGCQSCPACLLRNEGIQQFMQAYPHLISILF